MTLTLVQETCDVIRQRRDALTKANRIRRLNSDLKREIEAMSRIDGGRRVMGVLLNPNDHGAMKVSDLIVCVKGIGVVKTERLCRKAHVVSTKRLDRLSVRQLEELAFHLCLLLEPKGKNA
jgi:hypothetical protein